MVIDIIIPTRLKDKRVFMLLEENLEQKIDPIAEEILVAIPKISNEDKGKLNMATEIIPVKLVTVIKPSAYSDLAIKK